MAELERVGDILEVAIRIERNGINFYNKLHDIVKSAQAKDAFSFLAAEEEKHIGIFRTLLDKVSDYNPRFKYPGEYELFLDGVAYRAIAPFKKIEEFLSTKNIGEALGVGMDLEIGSIIFYSELYKQFKSGDKKYIRKVINEEKSHLARLKSIKDKLKL